MKRYMFFIFVLFLFPLSVFADSGHSTIVMDVDSGRILYQNNVHEKHLIASITKIMTCIIVLENSPLDKEITVGEEVLSMYGTNIYIEVGEVLTVKDLLYGLMLRSGNDAAITLAVNLFGSEEEFVSLMNEKASEIGMQDTTFSNPHGLDEETKNFSTAYDMALLSQYAYQNKTYREIISTKKYTTKSSLKSYVWYNRMSLINQYSKCIGGKNGYTPSAGKTLVSLAEEENLTLTIISLDDADIYANHKSLYEKYFKQYRKYTILDKSHFFVDSSFADGELYIKNSFQYALLEDEIEDVSTLIELFPTTKDNVAGKVIIRLKEKEIGRVSIYRKIETKKEEKNIFQKLKNYLFDNLKKFMDGLQKRRIPLELFVPSPLDIYNSEFFTL